MTKFVAWTAARVQEGLNGKVVTLKQRKSHEIEVNLPRTQFNRIVTVISSLMGCFVEQCRLCTFWHNLHR